MIIIKDEITLSFLAQHCNMVKMIMNRDDVPQLKLDFDRKVLQHFLNWLQLERLTCHSIEEVKELCKLADYLDCYLYDFYDHLIKFMKKKSYNQFGHVMLYCYKLLKELNELTDDLFDKYRPLIYSYKSDYKDYDDQINYPRSESYPNDWLTIISILDVPFLEELDKLYDDYFNKFEEYDELRYSLCTLTVWDDIPADAINPEQEDLDRYYKLHEELEIYWSKYGSIN